MSAALVGHGAPSINYSFLTRHRCIRDRNFAIARRCWGWQGAIFRFVQLDHLVDHLTEFGKDQFLIVPVASAVNQPRQNRPVRQNVDEPSREPERQRRADLKWTITRRRSATAAVRPRNQMNTSNPYEPQSISRSVDSAVRFRWRIVPAAFFALISLVGCIYAMILLAFVAYAVIDGNSPDGWWAGQGAKMLVGGLIGLVQAALLAFSSFQIWRGKYLFAIGIISSAILLRAMARIV